FIITRLSPQRGGGAGSSCPLLTDAASLLLLEESSTPNFSGWAIYSRVVVSWSVRALIVIGGIAFQPIVHQYIGLSIILHDIFDEDEGGPGHVKRAECKVVSLWDPLQLDWRVLRCQRIVRLTRRLGKRLACLPTKPLMSDWLVWSLLLLAVLSLPAALACAV